MGNQNCRFALRAHSIPAGYHELLPSGDFYHFVSSTFCSPSSLAHEACARLFSLLTGVPLEKLDRKLLPIYVDHLPAG